LYVLFIHDLVVGLDREKKKNAKSQIRNSTGKRWWQTFWLEVPRNRLFPYWHYVARLLWLEH